MEFAANYRVHTPVSIYPIKRREMEALSVDECKGFLKVAKELDWGALYALAVTTGMRPS
jgi:hypothetical protein